jgi:hypothetical protein
MKKVQKTPEQIISEIKLRMIYDPSKTLDQNKEILTEQDYGTMAGNTAKATGYAAGAGALAGAGLGAAAGSGAIATGAGAGVLGTAASGAVATGLGTSLGIQSLAVAGAVGGGIIAGAAALALTPVILWWMDKDNAKSKVEKMFKYCKENKSKIDQVPRGLSDEEVYGLSDQLYDALKGLGTDEEAIYGVFNSLKTISDLSALITIFDSENGSEGEGDLLEWLDSDIDMTSEWNKIYRPIRNIVRRFMTDLAKENPPKKDDTTPGGTTPGTPTQSKYRPCSGTYVYGCVAPAIGQVQGCLGLLQDNKFGPLTLTALKKIGKESFTDADIPTICKSATAPSTGTNNTRDNQPFPTVKPNTNAQVSTGQPAQPEGLKSMGKRGLDPNTQKVYDKSQQLKPTWLNPNIRNNYINKNL